MEISLKRLSYAIAQELPPKGVTALAITPGFMRTEAILQGFGVTEANWREAAEHNAEAKAWGFISSETPCFVGRAVAALAADPHVARRSGRPGPCRDECPIRRGTDSRSASCNPPSRAAGV